MRKKVLGLVMATLAICTTGAFAQSQTQQTGNNVQKECCKEKKGKKGGKEGKKVKDGNKAERKQGRTTPFTGIELTADQQQKIDKIQADRKSTQEKAKEEKKAAKEQERKAYDQQIAQVLTPDQYKIYESNKANMRAHKKHINAKGKHERSGR